MKNLINILIMTVLTLSAVLAQNKTSYDVILKSDQVLREYRAKASDTVSANKTTFTYTIFNKGQSQLKENFTQYWELALDSISGAAASVQVDYQRRKSIFSTWTTDSTQYFAGTVPDTTLTYTDTLARPDPYRRVKVTYASGFKIKIDWLSGLFLLE